MNKKKRGFTSRRHPEPALLPLRAALKGCYSGSNKTVSGSSRIFNKGFTLLEVLVVVLIIGILAAVAVPQYQKAVLKSRFSSLMPITKAIRDGNEAYFLGRGQYSNVLADLDITTQSGEETTVELSDDDDYAYVLSHRNDNPKNNLIMYQKHSANYPGEIHCEALEEDEQANWLCETGMNATQNLGTVITSGYTTYVLEGTGAGLPPGSDDDTMSCDKALSMGFTCTMNESGTEKKICKDGFCRTKTVNEDGSYTSVTCIANSEGICTSKLSLATYDANGNKTHERWCRTIESDGSCSAYRNSNAYDLTYDANGNMTSERICKTVNADGSCSEYDEAYYYTYDANGNKTSSRRCSTVAADGSCSAYSSSNAYDHTYDANGNQTSRRSCQTVASDGSCSAYSFAYDYTYDANRNQTSERRCDTVASDGSCSAYSSGTDYTYDANGNQTSKRKCNTVASDGSCSAYSDGTYYTYDANGNKTSERACQTVAADGSCSAYATYNSYDYTYDANGNQTSQRYCSTVASDGSCSKYRYVYDYTYDANGNQTSYRSCSTVNADGSCSAYSSGYDYTYDANGNMTSHRSCSTVNADGSCSAYSSGADYTYDEDGKKIASQSCSGANVNTATGECIAYNSTTTQSY